MYVHIYTIWSSKHSDSADRCSRPPAARDPPSKLRGSPLNHAIPTLVYLTTLPSRARYLSFSGFATILRSFFPSAFFIAPISLSTPSISLDIPTTISYHHIAAIFLVSCILGIERERENVSYRFSRNYEDVELFFFCGLKNSEKELK